MDSLHPQNRLEERLIAKAMKNGIPLSGSLELLPLCNMNCDMCYVRMSPEEQRVLGPLRRVEEWIALAQELKAAGTIFLLLTGGEPLLYPGFKDLYLQLQEMGFILTINTNGTLLDESLADFLAAHRPRRVNITLYGNSADTYDQLCHYGPGYAKAVQAIRLLRTRGVDVKVNGSLVRANQAQANAIINLAQDLGAAVNIDTYMYPAVRERSKPYQFQSRLSPEEAAEARLHIYRESHSENDYLTLAHNVSGTIRHTCPGNPEDECMRCQAGGSSFTINWQGMLRPCVMMPTPSFPVMALAPVLDHVSRMPSYSSHESDHSPSVLDSNNPMLDYTSPAIYNASPAIDCNCPVKGTDFSTAWKLLQEWRRQVRLCPDCAACQYRLICSRCAASCLHESGSMQGKPEYLCKLTAHYAEILQAASQMQSNEKRTAFSQKTNQTI